MTVQHAWVIFPLRNCLGIEAAVQAPLRIADIPRSRSLKFPIPEEGGGPIEGPSIRREPIEDGGVKTTSPRS
jgi:hypothetical protein